MTAAVPSETKAFRTPFALQMVTAAFLLLWTVLALFPLVWIVVMSLRAPIDALSSDPLTVLMGPRTLASSGGISILDAVLGVGTVAALVKVFRWARRAASDRLATAQWSVLPWLGLAVVSVVLSAVALFWLLPLVARLCNTLVSAIPLIGGLSTPRIGITFDHYRAVWIEHAFYRNFFNSMFITLGVVTISLGVGTLAGYGLARAHSNLAFWLLIAALVFRALPHSVLVTGYIPAFVNSREILAPLWDWTATGWFMRLFTAQPPSLYGQPWAIILVLVSINQPFTIWMMRSFFHNIPAELDEAARVDGCTHAEAFWRVIMPVMWPGVITTGLFSFLLAYNDYLVTALLLDAQSQTMTPAISQFLNRDTKSSDQIEAIAAAVSITAPLFLLVMMFQKQLVSGLTQGAVKG
jgi:trehalose/maltose transport system permease protein